jgi:hypothetical protein
MQAYRTALLPAETGGRFASTKALEFF